jgi:hypothetical protein
MSSNPAYDSSRYGGLPVAATRIGCLECDHETRGHHPGQCDYLSCPCCGPDLCVHCGHGVALHDNDVPACEICDCDRVVFDAGPGAL